MRSYFLTRIFEKLNRESSPEEKQLLPSQADLSCCKKKKKKRGNSSDFSTALWPTETDARGKNVAVAHIKNQHILSHSGYVAPAELNFPWIISLCLGIQPPARPGLQFNGKIILGVLVMCCAQQISSMLWCYFWKFLGTPWVWGQAGQTMWGHRYFLIYFSILCIMQPWAVSTSSHLPSHQFTLAKIWEFVVCPPIFVSHAEKSFLYHILKNFSRYYFFLFNFFFY